MVVERRDNHVVALLQELASEGLCHKVDALSGATHEEDVLLRWGIDETCHLLACSLILIRASCCQRMCTTMDV